MTTTAPTPAVRASTDMADAPRPDTASRAPAADAGAAASARPTLRSQVADNPLLSLFGAIIVVLLSAAIASPHMRINDTNDRLDRLEAAMMAGFAAQDEKIAQLDEKIDTRFADLDTRIDQLDARIDQLDLKLTALIAALQMTRIVDAALEGSLDLPAPADPDSPSTSAPP